MEFLNDIGPSVFWSSIVSIIVCFIANLFTIKKSKVDNYKDTIEAMHEIIKKTEFLNRQYVEELHTLETKIRQLLIIKDKEKDYVNCYHDFQKFLTSYSSELLYFIHMYSVIKKNKRFIAIQSEECFAILNLYAMFIDIMHQKPELKMYKITYQQIVVFVEFITMGSFHNHREIKKFLRKNEIN